ncbi:hypothetical protein PSQ90_02670 [Devosia rhodophyticola]|uniref:PepSY domain-containing protein n=1 Tax=Devosia rhodophyticola TaxID=3026423 RepID=A0ABY7Z042_9HYPH|nr:hypothetical protein [Devosia rhodophyticola]WDR06390.1 hypothetical protein PSQ90_02670 [Devosia rhodophyticola]
MEKPIAKFLTSLLLALGLVLATGHIASAQNACLDKRAIQDEVASGQIMSLDAVLASAGIDGNQKILSVQVCDQGGRMVYVIGVLSPDGQAQNLVLGAQ